MESASSRVESFDMRAVEVRSLRGPSNIYVATPISYDLIVIHYLLSNTKGRTTALILLTALLELCTSNNTIIMVLLLLLLLLSSRSSSSSSSSSSLQSSLRETRAKRVSSSKIKASMLISVGFLKENVWNAMRAGVKNNVALGGERIFLPKFKEVQHLIHWAAWKIRVVWWQTT